MLILNTNIISPIRLHIIQFSSILSPIADTGEKE